MNKKRFLSILISALLLMVVITGCTKNETNEPTNGETSSSDKVYTMKIGNTTSPGDILNITFVEMAEAIQERSNGRIKADVYPSGQLGTLRTMTEGLQNGTLEMATQSPGGLASFMPVYGVLELPYLYNSHQDVYDVVDGEIGQELAEAFLEKTGVRIASYWQNLYRQTSNNIRPINTLEDFKGISIRVPETKTVLDTLTALGANPMPMAFGEVYTALSQGTIDGQENPPAVIHSAKLYEVQKYISLTGHIYSPVVVTISEDFYQSLPEDLRTIVDEELIAAQSRVRKAAEELDEELLNEMREKVEVNEVDTSGWREVVQPVYDNLIKDVGPEAEEYIKKIESVVNN